MYVLVTYKNEDQMKNEPARVGQNIIQLYFRCSRAANSVVGGRVWPKIKTHSNINGCPCYLQE